MSLMGTLAKVAIGVAVAKGVGSLMKGSGGGLLNGGTAAPDSATQSGGGLGDILGQVLGGQSGGSGSSKGGLGDLLESLGGSMPSGQANAGQNAPSGQSGGLGDLLGQLTGAAGGGAAAGGIGGVLGNLLKQAQQGAGNSNGGSFGEVLNQSFNRTEKPTVQPTPDQEAVAALMLRAMIQAAKCDGKLDDGEREKLLTNLGDVSQDEMAFVEHELEQPVDVAGLARQVPNGMQQQVYAMSVMAIDLDSQAEAQYLHQLAQTLGLDQSVVNAMHDKLGVQRLYG